MRRSRCSMLRGRCRSLRKKRRLRRNRLGVRLGRVAKLLLVRRDLRRGRGRGRVGKGCRRVSLMSAVRVLSGAASVKVLIAADRERIADGAVLRVRGRGVRGQDLRAKDADLGGRMRSGLRAGLRNLAASELMRGVNGLVGSVTGAVKAASAGRLGKSHLIRRRSRLARGPSIGRERGLRAARAGSFLLRNLARARGGLGRIVAKAAVRSVRRVEASGRFVRAAKKRVAGSGDPVANLAVRSLGAGAVPDLGRMRAGRVGKGRVGKGRGEISNERGRVRSARSFVSGIERRAGSDARVSLEQGAQGRRGARADGSLRVRAADSRSRADPHLSHRAGRGSRVAASLDMGERKRLGVGLGVRPGVSSEPRADRLSRRVETENRRSPLRDRESRLGNR